ncbi:MAG: VOC family protein [Leptolyngbyaceae cyanobacterium MO_188.B28]|nr:VOC family protein [Leptolyngbyaceae cyanobacterium MO_188.B28]
MSQPQPSPIEGIYEVCIGVEDAIPQIQYWEQFGYRIGRIGRLTQNEANCLYGVDSAVQSIRMFHQDADHGLIRLMVWDTPINQGLQMDSMKVKGNRWATSLTEDVLNILNHAEGADATGCPIRYTPSYWEVIYQQDGKTAPFVDPTVGVREMLLLQPLTRQVFFERFNYTMPNYGEINPSSLLRTSQITHMGMIVQDDSKETLGFYDQVLGLLRVRDDAVTTYDSSKAARDFFDLQPGEQIIVTAFDDPRSSVSDFQAARSGRLYIVRLPESISLADRHKNARPGSLGLSLYTYRVRSLETYFERVMASMAREVTDIEPNEFGERSFSFMAPDGYFWTLIER